MRTPSDPRPGSVSLTIASPSEPPGDDASRLPHVPWLLAAVAWTAAVAVLGWLVVGVPVGISWLTAVHIPAVEVIATVGQGWLVVHGAPATLGGATIRMLPLGITLLLAVACAFAAHHAAIQYELHAAASAQQRALAWGSVTGACVGTYLLLGAIIAVIVGTPAQLGQALPGLVLVPLLGASVGTVAGLGLDPPAGLPGWVRRLPRALAVGTGVVGLGALSALVVALVAHRGQVLALHEALAPDAVGAAILALVQAAYLPNLLAWAGSFVLGAGVVLGPGGLVAPGVTDPVLLPAIPVLGAVPSLPGPADRAWLAVGPAAGAASAWWLLRGTAPAWRTGLWQGAVAGLATGVAWVFAAWFTSGDLGTQQLAGFGPRFPDLLWWGTLPLAAAGALYGLGRALLLARRRASAAADEATAIG